MASWLRSKLGPVVPFLGAPALVGVATLALVSGVAWAGPGPTDVGAGKAEVPAVLALSAEGEVAVAPDIAVLQMGVSAQATTGAEAIRLNRERMNAALTTLKASGVAAKDIQTAGFSLNPQYVYDANKPPRLTGYLASNTVSAVVRDIARAGAVIDAVTASGANQINGISFDIADRRKAEDEARRLAVKALQDKAELYAAATGLHILRLTRLSEGGGYVPAPMPQRVYAMAKMADQAPTSVEPGEMRVRISIDATYDLQR
jgi:uncharacterized protein YggE